MVSFKKCIDKKNTAIPAYDPSYMLRKPLLFSQCVTFKSAVEYRSRPDAIFATVIIYAII